MKFHIFFKKCSLFSIDSKNYLLCCFGWEQQQDLLVGERLYVSLYSYFEQMDYFDEGKICIKYQSLCFYENRFSTKVTIHFVNLMLFVTGKMYHCRLLCFRILLFSSWWPNREILQLFIYIRSKRIQSRALIYNTHTHTSHVLSAANLLVTVLWRCLLLFFLFAPFCLF